MPMRCDVLRRIVRVAVIAPGIETNHVEQVAGALPSQLWSGAMRIRPVADICPTLRRGLSEANGY